MSPWIDRVGLILNFLAFWFALPEILGAEKLSRLEIYLEQQIERLLPKLRRSFKQSTGRELPLTFSGLWEQERTTIIGLASSIIAIFVAIVLFLTSHELQSETDLLFTALIPFIIGIFVSGVLIVLGAINATRLLRFLHEGEHGEQVRQLLILIGGVIYTLGFLLQLIATF